jgi:hypothetical protein
VGGVERRHIVLLKRGPKATNFEVATTTIRKYASRETPDASTQSTLSLFSSIRANPMIWNSGNSSAHSEAVFTMKYQFIVQFRHSFQSPYILFDLILSTFDGYVIKDKHSCAIKK